MESKDALVAILALIAMLSSAAGIAGSIAASYFSHRAKAEAAAARLAMLKARQEAREESERLTSIAEETHKIVNSQREAMLTEIQHLKDELVKALRPILPAQKVLE